MFDSSASAAVYLKVSPEGEGFTPSHRETVRESIAGTGGTNCIGGRLGRAQPRCIGSQPTLETGMIASTNRVSCDVNRSSHFQSFQRHSFQVYQPESGVQRVANAPDCRSMQHSSRQFSFVSLDVWMLPKPLPTLPVTRPLYGRKRAAIPESTAR